MVQAKFKHLTIFLHKVFTFNIVLTIGIEKYDKLYVRKDFDFIDYERRALQKCLKSRSIKRRLV